jgi:flagellar protein FlaF
LTALTNARRAYANAAAPTRTPRNTEYTVLARITHRMRDAADAGPQAFPQLADALHDNRRLWTIFATDVVDVGNGLPEDLRARILYLAQFTLQHTSKVLSRTASPAALIEINASILAGLRAEAA